MAICFEVESVPSRISGSPSPERQRVAEVLRVLRQGLGLSQEAMAQRVGLSYAGYRPYEQGRRELSMEQIPVFADALEITRPELASRLGLSQVELHSVYAAEFEQLIEQVADDEVKEELMRAVRAMARVASATSSADPA